MKNAKLVYFLRQLTEKDRNQFKLYVASPLFNKRESLKRLLSVVEDHFVARQDHITKEQAYELVYPQHPFNESSLKTSMTQLLSLLKDFLAFQQFKQDSTPQNLFLIRSLNRNREEKHFKVHFQKAIREVAHAGLDAGEYHHQMMELEKEYYAYTYRMPG